MVVNTGWHDDEITVAGYPFDGGCDECSVGLIGSYGNLSVGRDMVVNTDGGNDDIDIFYVTADKLLVFAGSDDDNVCVFNSVFFSGATLNGGPGEADGLSTDLISPNVSGFEGPADCPV